MTDTLPVSLGGEAVPVTLAVLDLVSVRLGAGNLRERLTGAVGETFHDEELFLTAFHGRQQLEQQVL
jgi:hypothetical protein